MLSIKVDVNTECNSSVSNNEVFEYEVEFGKLVEPNEGDKPKKKLILSVVIAIIVIIAAMLVLVF